MAREELHKLLSANEGNWYIDFGEEEREQVKMIIADYLRELSSKRESLLMETVSAEHAKAFSGEKTVIGEDLHITQATREAREQGGQAPLSMTFAGAVAPGPETLSEYNGQSEAEVPSAPLRPARTRAGHAMPPSAATTVAHEERLSGPSNWLDRLMGAMFATGFIALVLAIILLADHLTSTPQEVVVAQPTVTQSEVIAGQLALNSEFIEQVASKAPVGPQGEKGEQGVTGIQGKQGLPGHDAVVPSVEQLLDAMAQDPRFSNSDIQSGREVTFVLSPLTLQEILSEIAKDARFTASQGDQGPEGKAGLSGFDPFKDCETFAVPHIGFEGGVLELCGEHGDRFTYNYTGKRISAMEAKELGLLDYITKDVSDRVK